MTSDPNRPIPLAGSSWHYLRHVCRSRS